MHDFGEVKQTSNPPKQELGCSSLSLAVATGAEVTTGKGQCCRSEEPLARYAICAWGEMDGRWTYQVMGGGAPLGSLKDAGPLALAPTHPGVGAPLLGKGGTEWSGDCH